MNHLQIQAPVAPNKLSGKDALKELQQERDRYWQNARQEVYRGAREIFAQHEDEKERGLAFSKLIRGNPRRRELALTFDDGPHPAYTPEILAILGRYRVPAAFFVVGEMAEKAPELVRAESAQGHVVANHTYHHVSLIKIPAEYVADEIKACGKVIQTILGKPPTWFRPPGGEYNREVAQISQALGYTMALWTADPGDYNRPGKDVILQKTLQKTQPGGILLLHDGVDQTIACLPQMLETLQKQGYRFVSLDDLKKKQGAK
ncbi:polysaccharide deacetylase family protein [Armatimonas rosea]|uniref:Peptidoglycan/xylan/chitin deacetylase (PgdA/CDA1 family) n=1 Tax=Armatimonas rosea TaxID=685828 RepID=A0A7W9SSI6_ARMRO|nr:polysaccharide deacetylase family protein [Armatimonas rosea]MBB6051443.1 peptidoglycan/xylan/chitin deacetylase (PgdA/CDA1 family) [Armatimonas rosea]